MLVTLFFLFVAAVVFHFIYEGILAPSLRFELRMQLFKTRDEIRYLKLQYPEEFDGELYDFIQDGLNKQLKLLPNINIVGLVHAFQRVKNNPELEQAYRALEAKVNECSVDGVKQLYEEGMPRIFGLAFIANSGGWIVYAIPPVVFGFLCAFAWMRLRSFVSKILEMPDDDLRNTFVYN